VRAVAGESRRKRLRALLERAGVPAADPRAFEAAFVHESAVKEKLAAQSNERLEFFGDAVLGFTVARSLYERYPKADEGELALRKAALIADTALASTAERLGFDDLMLLGAGLAKAAPARRRSALADAFEAFLAVLYRECGAEAVAAFVWREHVSEFEALGTEIDDPKSVLQEWTQRRFGTVPRYTERFEGPDHERTFYAEVTVEGDVRAEGIGPSKKIAQRAAAARVLELLRERYDDVHARALSSPVAVPSPAAAKVPRKRRPATKPARAGAVKRART
jgi:ribonuclease-3